MRLIYRKLKKKKKDTYPNLERIANRHTRAVFACIPIIQSDFPRAAIGRPRDTHCGGRGVGEFRASRRPNETGRARPPGLPVEAANWKTLPDLGPFDGYSSRSRTRVNSWEAKESKKEEVRGNFAPPGKSYSRALSFALHGFCCTDAPDTREHVLQAGGVLDSFFTHRNYSFQCGIGRAIVWWLSDWRVRGVIGSMHFARVVSVEGGSCPSFCWQCGISWRECWKIDVRWIS